MVKCKTDISLDEWLARSAVIPEASYSVAAVPEPRPVPIDVPTEEVAVDPVTTGPVSAPVANVATHEEGSSDWFWSILEQCGYELW